MIKSKQRIGTTKEMEKQVNPEKWVEGLINDIYWREYYLKKDKEENE